MARPTTTYRGRDAAAIAATALPTATPAARLSRIGLGGGDLLRFYRHRFLVGRLRPHRRGPSLFGSHGSLRLDFRRAGERGMRFCPDRRRLALELPGLPHAVPVPVLRRPGVDVAPEVAPQRGQCRALRVGCVPGHLGRVLLRRRARLVLLPIPPDHVTSVRPPPRCCSSPRWTALPPTSGC